MSETTWRLVPLNGITKEMRRGAQREARHARTSEPFSVLSAKIRGGIDAAPKPPAGLYEAREDGTARRVEVDVVGALRAAERALLSPFPMEDQVIARLGTGQSAIEQVRAVLRALTGEER